MRGDTTSNGGTAPVGQGAIDEQRLKMALTAFKKRLKLTKLDEESRMGGGRPTTSGKKSALVGIVPPREWPREVWEELAKRGQIRDAGGGFYAMV